MLRSHSKHLCVVRRTGKTQTKSAVPLNRRKKSSSEGAKFPSLVISLNLECLRQPMVHTRSLRTVKIVKGLSHCCNHTLVSEKGNPPNRKPCDGDSSRARTRKRASLYMVQLTDSCFLGVL